MKIIFLKVWGFMIIVVGVVMGIAITDSYGERNRSVGDFKRSKEKNIRETLPGIDNFDRDLLNKLEEMRKHRGYVKRDSLAPLLWPG